MTEAKVIGVHGTEVKLLGEKGDTKIVDRKMLSDAIRLGRIKIVKSFARELEDKARALGFKQMDGYLYQISDNKIYIVIESSTSEVRFDKNQEIAHFDGGLVVSGGANLKSCDEMFRDVGARYIDLRKLETKNVVDVSGMFLSCGLLEGLDLSSFDTSRVTKMDSMFYGCSSLEKLDLSRFNTSKVTDMNNMFYACASLRKLDLSNFNTSKVKDMHKMFYSCVSLRELDLSNFDTSRVTDMYCMFYNCESLRELDLSSFDISGVADRNGMFSCCTSLEKLDLGKGHV